MALSTKRTRAVSRELDGLDIAGIGYFRISVADLSAGTDITARAEFVCPFPLEVLEAKIVPIAASTGVDGSNTVAVVLSNITGSATIASLTSTTDYAANTPLTMTLTDANVHCAADDVLGIAVTQGTNANTAGFYVQVFYRPRPL